MSPFNLFSQGGFLVKVQDRSLTISLVTKDTCQKTGQQSHAKMSHLYMCKRMASFQPQHTPKKIVFRVEFHLSTIRCSRVVKKSFKWVCDPR